MANWPDGEVIDLVGEMFTLTTTVALRALFSSQLGSEQADRLRRAFNVFLRGTYTRAALRLAGRLPTPGNRRYTRCIGEEFGLAEATLILASMAARWNLAPEAGTTVSRPPAPCWYPAPSRSA